MAHRKVVPYNGNDPHTQMSIRKCTPLEEGPVVQVCFCGLPNNYYQQIKSGKNAYARDTQPLKIPH